MNMTRCRLATIKMRFLIGIFFPKEKSVLPTPRPQLAHVRKLRWVDGAHSPVEACMGRPVGRRVDRRITTFRGNAGWGLGVGGAAGGGTASFLTSFSAGVESGSGVKAGLTVGLEGFSGAGLDEAGNPSVALSSSVLGLFLTSFLTSGSGEAVRSWGAKAPITSLIFSFCMGYAIRTSQAPPYHQSQELQKLKAQASLCRHSLKKMNALFLRGLKKFVY